MAAHPDPSIDEKGMRHDGSDGHGRHHSAASIRMTDNEDRVAFATTVRRYRETLTRRGPLILGAIGTVLFFVSAIQLLGAATEAARPFLVGILGRVVVGDGTALGLSWLMTYGLTNGSVAAAIALSLFNSELVSITALFLMIVGSRLGGTAIVVLVGGLDYLQDPHRQTLSEGTSLGLLTFLISFSIYVPVGVLGYLVVRATERETLRILEGVSFQIRPLDLLDPVSDAILIMLGPFLTVVLALGILFGSLWLFDELLERVETDTLRTSVFGYFERRWTAFAIGIVITVLTTSVAFSLGVVVPLYNRRYVRRDEIVPYVLGANVGTLADTLVVAFVFESPIGISIVALVGTIAALLTILALLAYDPYVGAIGSALDRLVEDRRYFVGFGVLLLLVPTVFLLVPHL